MSDRCGYDPSAEPLSLAHRLLIEPLLRDLNFPLSEYSFANLYLFRSVHHYTLVLEPIPHVLGITYDGVKHAMPLVRFAKPDVEFLLARANCIYPVTEEIATQGVAYGLQSRWNEDDTDYLYDSRRLAALEGHKLRQKRLQAAAFVAQARPRCESIQYEHVDQALDTLELWARQVSRPREDTDYDACREALCNFNALSFNGLIVSDATGKPCAFLLAQRLGSGGAAVHFAKGNRDYPGIYAYLFSQFAARSGATWLNFEQDLGKPGLRRAKRALGPTDRLRKYRLFASQP